MFEAYNLLRFWAHLPWRWVLPRAPVFAGRGVLDSAADYMLPSTSFARSPILTSDSHGARGHKDSLSSTTVLLDPHQSRLDASESFRSYSPQEIEEYSEMRRLLELVPTSWGGWRDTSHNLTLPLGVHPPDSRAVPGPILGLSHSGSLNNKPADLGITPTFSMARQHAPVRIHRFDLGLGQFMVWFYFQPIMVLTMTLAVAHFCSDGIFFDVVRALGKAQQDP